jgi:hypothetical protein
MGTKQEELQSTTGCLAKAAYDEPIFILRAHDKLAPEVVRHWITLVEGARIAEGGSTEKNLGCKKLQEAHSLAARMEAWQREHGCKVPD